MLEIETGERLANIRPLNWYNFWLVRFCFRLKKDEMNSTLALAQHQPFNPWVLPDTFSVYELAPDEVRPWLHPHWQTQRAVHPIWSYMVGVYFLLLGTAIFNIFWSLKSNLFVLKVFWPSVEIRWCCGCSSGTRLCVHLPTFWS